MAKVDRLKAWKSARGKAWEEGYERIFGRSRKRRRARRAKR